MTPYATVAEATQYLTARGQADEWASVTNQEAALVRGSDYIDQRYRKQLSSGRWASMFSGEKTGGRSQYREWPRTGAEDYYGDPIPDGVIPDEVKYAAIEAALREGQNPGSLLPDYDPSQREQGPVTKEKVGELAVEYAAPTSQTGSGDIPNVPSVPEITRIIAPLLTGPGAGVYGQCIGMRLVR